MKAAILYRHLKYTRPELAENLAQSPDMLFSSAKQSELMPLDQEFRDARYDVPATLSATKARTIAN